MSLRFFSQTFHMFYFSSSILSGTIENIFLGFFFWAYPAAKAAGRAFQGSAFAPEAGFAALTIPYAVRRASGQRGSSGPLRGRLAGG